MVVIPFVIKHRVLGAYFPEALELVVEKKPEILGNSSWSLHITARGFEVKRGC